MSKHKWNYEVTDIEALQAAYPKAVETITTMKVQRQVITKLLDCEVSVPGIKLLEAASAPAHPTANGAENTQPKQEASAGTAEKVDMPKFLREKERPSGAV